MLSIANLTGVSQPKYLFETERRLVECNWRPSYTLTVPTTWTSGVYLAKLTGNNVPISSGNERYIIFVVRDDNSKSDLLFQCSVNTYQAYNAWTGTDLAISLYGNSSGNRSANCYDPDDPFNLRAKEEPRT